MIFYKSIAKSASAIKVFFSILGIILVAGCETPGGSNSLRGGSTAANLSNLPENSGTEDIYAIRADDMLELVVHNQPEFSVTRRVSADGKFYAPILGKIDVAGKRPEVVESEIQQMLLDGYLTLPEVTIIVVEKAKKRFVVIGQVKNPGYYAAPGEMDVTLIEAVAMAGGYTRIAGDVVVTRVVNGVEKKFNIGRKSGSNQDASFLIYAGDMIEIEESIF